jgi:hypothetical protein
MEGKGRSDEETKCAYRIIIRQTRPDKFEAKTDPEETGAGRSVEWSGERAVTVVRDPFYIQFQVLRGDKKGDSVWKAAPAGPLLCCCRD